VKPSQAHVAITALERSKGWKYLHKVMEQEVLSAAMAIAETPDMSVDEINFRRGSIWAAKSLLSLPEKLKLRLENEIALTRDDSGSAPL